MQEQEPNLSSNAHVQCNLSRGNYTAIYKKYTLVGLDPTTLGFRGIPDDHLAAWQTNSYFDNKK